MKRTDAESIGDVLRLTLQECNMTSRLDECRAVALWEPLMGAHIARNTLRPTVLNGVMTVKVASAAMRSELHWSRSRIIEMLNERLGRRVIREIRFT